MRTYRCKLPLSLLRLTADSRLDWLCRSRRQRQGQNTAGDQYRSSSLPDTDRPLWG